MKDAGRHIAWGKYVNDGKMCLATNYVLCLKAAVKEYYGEVCVSVCGSVCECVLHMHVCTCMCMCVSVRIHMCSVHAGVLVYLIVYDKD